MKLQKSKTSTPTTTRYKKTGLKESSSSYVCYGVGPLVDPFWSHLSRSLFKGLPWFLLQVGEYSEYSEAFMTETQNGFRKGQSCADPTFCLKLLIEKRREFNLETHSLFIDYEKAFDNIKRQILFNILKSRHIPDTLLKAIVDIYTQNKILIKFNNKLSKPVEINKGVRQGCPLSPTLFDIYLDEIITKWQKQDTIGIKLSKTSNCQRCYLQD